MTNSNCKKCEIGLLESTSNFIVCTNCGDITNENLNLVDSGCGNNNNCINSNGYPVGGDMGIEGIKTKSNSRKRQYTVMNKSISISIDTSEILSNACHKLNLQTYFSEMVGIWNDWLVKKKNTRQPNIIRSGALIYIIVKKYHKPLHLSEIANTLGASTNKISALAKNIMQELNINIHNSNANSNGIPSSSSSSSNDNSSSNSHDISIFVEKSCQHFSTFYNVDQLRGLKKLVVDIIEMTDKTSIKDGRRPISIIGAAVYLAISFYKVPNLPKLNVEKVCETIGSSLSTTKIRVKELEISLLSYTTERKYLSHINPANLYSNIGIIVKDYLLQSENNEEQEEDEKEEEQEEEHDQLEDNNYNSIQLLGNDDDTQSYYSETYSTSSISSKMGKAVPSRNKRVKLLFPPTLPSPNLQFDNKDVFDEFLPDPLPYYEAFLNRIEFSNLYQLDYKKHYGVICTYPPAYIQSTYRKFIRRLKIIKCKYLLISSEKVGHNPPFILTESEKIFFGNYNCFLPYDQEKPKDEIYIDRLLLQGVSDEVIYLNIAWVDPNVKKLENIIAKHPDLYSTEVGDEDIPNSDMNLYIKSPEEINQWQEILSKLYDQKPQINNNNSDNDSDNDY